VWLAAVLVTVGCGGKPDPARETHPEVRISRSDTVVVEGLLTNEIVECAAVRTPAGEVFALEDVPSPFDEWERFIDERFMVVGEETAAGRCGDARTLRVLDMGLVLPPLIRPDPNGSNG
jgi:hypothetical protein